MLTPFWENSRKRKRCHLPSQLPADGAGAQPGRQIVQVPFAYGSVFQSWDTLDWSRVPPLEIELRVHQAERPRESRKRTSGACFFPRLEI
jgi:hypothetical protein